jgi:dipeptidyl aminopeptidase/acylaminoacyl peptidase
MDVTTSLSEQMSTYPVNQWMWLSSNLVLTVEQTPKGVALTSIDIKSLKRQSFLEPEISTIKMLAKNKQATAFTVALRYKHANKSGIYRFEVSTLSKTKMHELYDFQKWYFDDDLNLICTSKNTGLYHEEVFVASDSGNWKTITSPDSSWSRIGLNMGGVLSVSSDGEAIFLMNNYSEDRVSLKRYGLTKKRVKTLYSAGNHDLIWADAHIHPENGNPMAVTSYGAEVNRHIVDSSVAQDYDFLNREGHASLQFVNSSANHKYWLMRQLSGARIDYYLYDRDRKETRHLFSNMESLRHRKLAVKSPLVVRTADGLNLECQLLFDPKYDGNNDSIPDSPLPTIMFVHGGPWIGFYQFDPFYHLLFEYWTTRGYAVINTQFRSGAGFGRNYLEAGKKQWGSNMLSDLLAIRESSIRKGIGDSTRIGIWGWSYGGYAVMSALTFAPDKFACGFSMYGLSDLLLFMEEKQEVMKRNGRFDWWVENLGDPNCDGGRDWLINHSPFYFAGQIERPILLTHGVKDNKAPVNQSDQMAKKLIERNKDVSYFTFTEEGHDYRQKSSWTSVLSISEAFFHQHLKGEMTLSQTTNEKKGYQWITGRELLTALPENF